VRWQCPGAAEPWSLTSLREKADQDRPQGGKPRALRHWRRLYADGALSAVGAGEEVVPTSQYRALQHQVRERQRLLGK
jgi:hypothetical protein